MADGRSGGSARGSDDPSEGHESIEDRLRALHDHLAATAERPVETDASRWLGEAEAVAADVAAGLRGEYAGQHPDAVSGVVEYLERMRDDPAFDTAVVPLGEGIAVSRYRGSD